MTKAKASKLSKKIVGALFKLGDDGETKCGRIQFKGYNEEDLGGMQRKPLERFFTEAIQNIKEK